MGKNRLEAFSDGVLAIIITIMVLELKLPKGNSIESLKPLFHIFFNYALSFLYVGIYWNNHHHLLHTCKVITGRILWSNLHLLFLALFIAVCNRLDGRKFFRPFPDGLLWFYFVDGSRSLYHSSTRNYCFAGAKFDAKKSCGKRYKRKSLCYFLSVSIYCRNLGSFTRTIILCYCCSNLAYS